MVLELAFLLLPPIVLVGWGSFTRAEHRALARWSRCPVSAQALGLSRAGEAVDRATGPTQGS